MLNQIFAITNKEFKVLLHDRGAIVGLFIIPIAFILVMTTSLQGVFNSGSSDNPISLLVVNQDQGEISGKVITDLRDIDGLIVIENYRDQSLTRQAAESLIEQRAYSIAVVFPFDFSTAILGAAGDTYASPAMVSLITDPTVGSQLLSPVRGLLQGYIEREASSAQAPVRVRNGMDQIAQNMPAAPAGFLTTIRTELARGMTESQVAGWNLGVDYQVVSPAVFQTLKEPTSVEQNVPGYTLYGVFFIMQIIATSLFREKDQGTLRRLQAAPLSKATLLIGKLIPYYLINLLQIALMFLIGVVVFGMNLGNASLALLLLSMVTAAVATGLGLMLASLGRTLEQVSSLGTVLSIVLAAVGGMMVPISVMPEFMRKIAYLTPHAWALNGYQDVIVRGQGLQAVLPSLGILLAYAAAFWGLAVWRYRMD